MPPVKALRDRSTCSKSTAANFPRDAAGDVVRQPEVGRVVWGQLAEEEPRDGAGEAVAAEVDAGEIGDCSERRRNWAGEVEEGERGQEGRHGTGHGGPGDGEEGGLGDGRRDGAGDAREVVEHVVREVSEAGDGVGDGAGEVRVLEHGEADDAGGGGVAVDVVPVAAGRVGRPGREVVGVAQRRLHRQQRSLVVGVAPDLFFLGGGEEERGPPAAHLLHLVVSSRLARRCNASLISVPALRLRDK
jgi:hypothetical protein